MGYSGDNITEQALIDKGVFVQLEGTTWQYIHMLSVVITHNKNGHV